MSNGIQVTSDCICIFLLLSYQLTNNKQSKSHLDKKKKTQKDKNH